MFLCILGSMHERQYRLVMFDGPDGIGKTTQIDWALQELEAANQRVFVTRIHGGTDFGEGLRKVTLDKDIARTPLAEHYVYMGMHAQHRAEWQDLVAGTVILLDRSPLSDWSYQIVASGLKSEEAKANIKHSMTLFKPDLIICYKASAAVLRERMLNRPESEKRAYYKEKPAEYHEAVACGYEEAAKIFGATVIDANQSIDSVHSETMKQIQNALSSIKL